VYPSEVPDWYLKDLMGGFSHTHCFSQVTQNNNEKLLVLFIEVSMPFMVVY